MKWLTVRRWFTRSSCTENFTVWKIDEAFIKLDTVTFDVLTVRHSQTIDATDIINCKKVSKNRAMREGQITITVSTNALSLPNSEKYTHTLNLRSYSSSYQSISPLLLGCNLSIR